ncbi:TIM barrel protein [Ideonella sp. DXS22W]|uniref:TIM barrel protein n=1 Tax=Pseudaquabacterium inlustre TaxID=2984192 RepID=A0ABU9CLS8_9BURK
MTLRWSYALNAWKGGHDLFVRPEDHEKAFKTLSACGFDAIALTAGTGRWEPLGRKDWIETYYGSVGGLQRVLAAAGIHAVSSCAFDPGAMILEEGAFGRSVLNPDDHGRIVASMAPYAELLAELGGDTLVARGLPAWRAGCTLDAALAATVAHCWNAAGRMAAEHGVRLSLAFDGLSQARSIDDIARLLDACDPACVGLSIDTADAVIAGIDPLALHTRLRERLWHVQLKNTRHWDALAEYQQPGAERTLLAGGGAREIARWYCELGDPHGLVDVKGFCQQLLDSGYSGWTVVDCPHSPLAAESALLNGWYVQNVLAALEPV